MRTSILLILCLLGTAAAAKERPWTPAWNGLWAEADGQHRCVIDIVSTPVKHSIRTLCQLGPDGVYGYAAPIPAWGAPLLLTATAADLGSPSAGHITWGTVRWYPVCNEGQPEVIGTVYTGALAQDIRLHPQGLPRNPCAVGGAP